jgi:hypothetical protein
VAKPVVKVAAITNKAKLRTILENFDIAFVSFFDQLTSSRRQSRSTGVIQGHQSWTACFCVGDFGWERCTLRANLKNRRISVYSRYR